ncbi:MAG: carboxypeptidase regulatory-like domain-containing protein [Kofleriaceae bacterium]
MIAGALWLAEPARAEPDVSPRDEATLAAPVQLGGGAMPGGQKVATAAVLPAGHVGWTAFAGVGLRDELLAPTHRFVRGLGGLAISYSPLRALSLSLSLDGRYDRHSGLPPEGEDGYVGDPRVAARWAQRAGALSLGLQAGLWLPGREAPSVALGAATYELRALATAPLGAAAVTLNAGARLDHSAKAVAEPELLTPQDQVSLGLSDYSAALVGAMLTFARGSTFVNLEFAADYYLGDGAPSATTRALLSGGFAVGRRLSINGFVQLASAPDARKGLSSTGAVPLVPYEPAIALGLGFSGRFGEATRPARGKTTVVSERAAAPAESQEAKLTGVVFDDRGDPVAGAKVTVETAEKTGRAVTDSAGAYAIGELPSGPAKLTIEVDGKQTREISVVLVEGGNAVPGVRLEPALPPGELRGNVRARVGGKAIGGATIVITPGDYKVVSEPDGTFSLEIPPGTYQMTTSAPGFAPQSIEAVVDQEGVTVKFINLDKK